MKNMQLYNIPKGWYPGPVSRAEQVIKTVQGNLGHATASFTLDVYGHVTMQMKQASAARMEEYIKSVSGG